MVADTGRIFVKNLAYLVSEEDLEDLFKSEASLPFHSLPFPVTSRLGCWVPTGGRIGEFGELAEVVIPVDYKTQQSKGYGIVTFLFPEHAVTAFTQLDGSIYKVPPLCPARPTCSSCSS